MPRKQNRRPKQNEMPLTGPGVEICTDKKLLELGTERIDQTDTKNSATKRLKEIDAEIINRMHVIRLKVFRVAEKLFRINLKESVKVVKVKDKQIEQLDAADAEGA